MAVLAVAFPRHPSDCRRSWSSFVGFPGKCWHPPRTLACGIFAEHPVPPLQIGDRSNDNRLFWPSPSPAISPIAGDPGHRSSAFQENAGTVYARPSPSPVRRLSRKMLAPSPRLRVRPRPRPRYVGFPGKCWHRPRGLSRKNAGTVPGPRPRPASVGFPGKCWHRLRRDLSHLQHTYHLNHSC
jgi:hypothetical protein